MSLNALIKIILFIQNDSFKANVTDDEKIPSEIALPYLLLWHCVLNFCSRAAPELRSSYARWITMHRYEEVKEI
jgi:hypothetical protein